MSRKLVEVRWLLDRANGLLESPTTSQVAKAPIACLIEDVLHQTGNYAGYRTLEPYYLPEKDAKGELVINPEMEPYSRVYFIHKNLRRKRE